MLASKLTVLRWLSLLCTVLALGPHALSWAQPSDFPNRPITIVVPFPPGGTADMLPRLVAEKLPELLGQPVVVTNRPGAAGMLGAEFVSRANPDGYTLLVVPPHFFISDLLYKISFEPTKFMPVSILASYPNVLLGSNKLPVQDIAQLLTFSRTNPKPLNIASAGSGTSQHLTAELLKEMAKVDMMHVPYKGSSPAMNDLIAGHVDLMFDNLIAATPYIQSGKLRLLAVGSTTRSKLFPNTPAVHEVLPGFESVTWMGVVAPPGTPAPVVEKLSQAISTAMKTPKIRKQIEDLQAEPLGSTSAVMAEAIRKDGLRWSQVIRSAKITVD
jgi:tripartite-type tricarboxylate transporter receptor subunit TctC